MKPNSYEIKVVKRCPKLSIPPEIEHLDRAN